MAQARTLAAAARQSSAHASPLGTTGTPCVHLGNQQARPLRDEARRQSPIEMAYPRLQWSREANTIRANSLHSETKRTLPVQSLESLLRKLGTGIGCGISSRLL
ncbi:hypothetical protein D3C85_1284400 [compost metagenome]